LAEQNSLVQDTPILLAGGHARQISRSNSLICYQLTAAEIILYSGVLYSQKWPPVTD